MAHFNDLSTLANGIVFAGSLVKVSDVTDGTTKTYLLGEKTIDPDYYATGQDGGDNEYGAGRRQPGYLPLDHELGGLLAMPGYPGPTLMRWLLAVRMPLAFRWRFATAPCR